MTQLLLLLLGFLTSTVAAEWFSSFTHILIALDAESKLLDLLDQYIDNEQERMNYLQSLHEKMSTESCSNAADATECMGNPTNQFALMKRLAYGWGSIYAAAADRNASARFLWSLSRKPKLPTSDDVVGSIKGLIRIQQTYGFSAGDISRGIAGGSTIGAPLIARDCYDIAHVAQAATRYGVCFEWTVEAKQLVSVGDYSIPMEDVLYLLARCAYDLGKLHLALESVLEIAKIAPDFIEIAPFHRHVLGEAQRRGVQFRDDFSSVFEEYALVDIPKNYTKCEKLCQQHSVAKSLKNLRCYLWNGNRNPRLLLQPIKIEVESERPMLYRFHDFISAGEMQRLKGASTPSLQRAAIVNRNGSSKIADYRVTKTAFLHDAHDRTATRVSRRIGDTAGFDMRYAESMAVANYGVGGHYAQHFDAFGNVSFRSMEDGNRVATVLLYLSDVDFGGNTVFPTAGIAVRPIKGSAIMWYNMFPNGTVDPMTLHAGCPVATGEKWIANKWIRERALSTCNSETSPKSPHRLLLNDIERRRTCT